MTSQVELQITQSASQAPPTRQSTFFFCAGGAGSTAVASTRDAPPEWVRRKVVRPALCARRALAGKRIGDDFFDALLERRCALGQMDALCPLQTGLGIFEPQFGQ